MKNMILTLGILLLMTMGMMYDADCMAVTGQIRHLRWVCEEMADAAAYCAETGKWQMAEKMAEEVLLKNMGSDSAELVWNLTCEGNTIRVKVRGQSVFLHLPLPERTMELSYETEISF